MLYYLFQIYLVKSLVIKLDKKMYGQDINLVEWHRSPKKQEMDGFEQKRCRDVAAQCTVVLLPNYKPTQFNMDWRLVNHIISVEELSSKTACYIIDVEVI